MGFQSLKIDLDRRLKLTKEKNSRTGSLFFKYSYSRRSLSFKGGNVSPLAVLTSVKSEEKSIIFYTPALVVDGYILEGLPNKPG